MLKLRTFLLPLPKWSSPSFTFSTAPVPKEAKVRVNNYDINYLAVGRGPHTVFCLPGALGTIWTDFKPQIEGFDREKFTVIVWDPPGYGKSRPPEKMFTADFYEKDAADAHEFMKALNIPRYSVLGWSDGGIVGMILAAKQPSVVNKLVVWGANSFILPNDLEMSNLTTRDTETWSQTMKQPMIDVYGEEYFAELCARWCDGTERVFRANNGDICSQMLRDIKCPTLILYGEEDPMKDHKVHVSYLQTHIQTSRIHLYPNGKHNIHIKYADDFNKRVQEHLLAPI